MVAVDPSELLRIAWADPASHLNFGRRARYRFDAPDGEYGTLYAAFDFTTAFVETVLRDHPQQARPSGVVILDYRELEQRRVIRLGPGTAPRMLNMVKLYAEGLAAAHTDNQISSRDHYPTTQRWSRAFHNHPIGADGIVYMSRYIGSAHSIVVFDRAREILGKMEAIPLLDHPKLPEVLEQFALGIDRH
jgi:hypothetical protein